MKNSTAENFVHLDGFTFGGRRAGVNILPTRQKGLYWQIGTHTIPLDNRIVSVETRKIVAQSLGRKLSIIEHICALKWRRFSCILDTEELPYFATANEVWLSLPEKIRKPQHPIIWVRPRVRSSLWVYPENRNRWVSMERSTQDQLRLEVTVDFPGIGRHTEEFIFPDDSLFDKVFAARPLAWPPKLRFLAMGMRFCGWPHYNKFLWPHTINDENRMECLREICLHRALDILGDMAVAHPYGLPAVNYRSNCAGHLADDSIMRENEWVT